MKKRMLALLLCLGLLPLGGCAALLERGHVSSTVHVDYAVEEEDESILRAETYPGLVQSILYFVDGHRGGGTIRLYHYAGDVEADLAAAREAVLDTPAGAYAVGSLEFKSTRILTYYEVKLTIRYTRTAREMEAIPEVTGLAGVRQELNRMVSEGGRSAAFLASYFTGDGAQVEQLLRLACCGGPGLYRHHQSIGFGGEQEHSAGISVSLYPETGARRIIEVKLDLPSAAKTDEDACTAQLDKAAFALLEEHPPAGEGYTVEELAAILRGVSGPWDSEGSCLAFDVLNGGGVRRSATSPCSWPWSACAAGAVSPQNRWRERRACGSLWTRPRAAATCCRNPCGPCRPRRTARSPRSRTSSCTPTGS